MNECDYLRADDPHYVYRFQNLRGETLYVGATGLLGHRLTTHMRTQAWWSEVDHIEVNVYPDCATARDAEAALIQFLQPTHNRIHTNHWPDPGGWETRRRNDARREARRAATEQAS